MNRELRGYDLLYLFVYAKSKNLTGRLFQPRLQLEIRSSLNLDSSNVGWRLGPEPAEGRKFQCNGDP